MKCFKHFDRDAICTEEVRVGKSSKGDILEFKPVCQQCLDEYNDYIKQEKSDELFGYLFVAATAITIFIFVTGYLSYKGII